MNNCIEKAVRRWNLYDVREIYENSHKAVYSAISDKHGDVILKWDSTPQIRTEYRMLNRRNGNAACRLFAFDEADGLLLEERIVPGTVLRKEASYEKRLDIFASVFEEIHTPETSGETYLDWMKNACVWCRTHPSDKKLAAMAEEALAITEELFGCYPDRVLLHGDLHHDNLLRHNDGTYRMIDPKGVVGPAIFDIPRFLLNEADTVHDLPDAEHIETCIIRLSERLGYPADDLRNLFFMEAVLANVWIHEDGEPLEWNLLELAEAVKKR